MFHLLPTATSLPGMAPTLRSDRQLRDTVTQPASSQLSLCNAGLSPISGLNGNYRDRFHSATLDRSQYDTPVQYRGCSNSETPEPL
ncbi:hypothetical protein ON010_g3773 [Phytophthora cinnamomi]|nr:hypothetical protein ON010_g3773 [Phytophthora cinnamomi]